MEMIHFYLLWMFCISFQSRISVNGECVKPDNSIFNQTVCEGKGIRWNSPVNGMRYYDGFIAMKSNMVISTCQAFCAVTPECRSAHLRDDHYCELWSASEMIEQHSTSIILTYECCNEDDEDCDHTLNSLGPSLSLLSVCGGEFIRWSKPLASLSVKGEAIGIMKAANVSTCQDFCYTTPICKSAVLKTDGDCLLMATEGPIINDPSATLLRYECCNSNDGQWSQWSAFSPCHPIKRVRTRTRQCDNPPPVGIGQYCQGSSEENSLCDVDGGWSEWSEFTMCDNQTGIEERTRKCENPIPMGNGKNCSGSPVEINVCQEIPCQCKCSTESWVEPTTTEVVTTEELTTPMTTTPWPELNSTEYQSSYGIRLRDHFILKKESVSSYNQCKYLCLLSNFTVYQVEDSSSSDFLCSCAVIVLKYLFSFPHRYVTNGVNDTLYSIYYYQEVGDETVSIFSNETDKPIIFYTLDDVTGGENLGTLSYLNVDYTLDNKRVTPHFDCPLGSHKVMQLLSDEKFLAEVNHEGNIELSPEGMTVSVWFKPNLSAFVMNFPLVDADEAGWALWNSPDPDQALCYYGWQWADSPNYDPQRWNNLAMRFLNGQLQCTVNGTETSQISTEALISFGKHFNIASRRYENGLMDDLRFYGCMAHLMLFPRKLSDEELLQFSNLVMDPLF